MRFRNQRDLPPVSNQGLCTTLTRHGPGQRKSKLTGNIFKTMSISRSNRLLEVDALRGLAALAVVLFHYTTRFTDLFPSTVQPIVVYPHGHYGVGLFFVISGFVIFMTLEKTVLPMDFVVSRFSRLFPTYWAAIFLTFGITHWLGLPGKLVDIDSALANMLMVHGLFRVPHVDGVYWTLEVELLFYSGMFLLYRINCLTRVHLFLFGLLLLRLAYYLLETQFGISLPWIVFRLLILQYIPWFALGVSVYLATSRSRVGACWPSARTAALAIATLWICESILVACLAMAFLVVVFLAANSKLSMLRFGPFVWLGTISYPLYLLHENIGWAVLLRLRTLDVPIDVAILMTLGANFFMAAVVSRWVERPAMQWIRSCYRRSHTPVGA